MENIKNYMPESPDFNQERLDKLKELFPDLFTSENKLNTEELKKLVEPDSISETERYEFRWFGKSNAKRNAFTPSNATLIYDEERSVNPAESENLIIEGENLEVLKLLSAAYREKIKCIYIDPPYNTGKDFVYSDNFTQDKKGYWEDAGIVEDGLKIDTNTETDGRYHSNWLNMMYSRLLVARQLLREDGVIFISIDDNEVHHLRKLCDDVFGEDNFIGIFTVNSSPSGIDYGHIAKTNDYAMFYGKNINCTETFYLEEAEKKFSFYDIVGGYNIAPLYNGNVAFNPQTRPNLYYPFYLNPNNIIENDFYEIDVEYRKDWIEVYPVISKKDGIQRVWRWGKPKAKENKNLEILGYKNSSGEYRIVQKNRLTSKLIRSILIDNEYSSRRGTGEIQDLFGKKIFSYPKPTHLIKDFVRSACKGNDLFLDFFAGSGVSGDAVFQLNQENAENIKFIIVQLPEKTDDKSEAYKAGYKKISDITIERNKRVIEKIIETKKAEQPDLFTEENKEENLKGLGFKVFKLAKSNFPRVDFAPDPTKTDAENVELLKKYIAEKEAQLVNAFNREELLTEILLKKGFNLNFTTEQQSQFTKNEILLAKDSEKETLICLDVTIAPETVEYFKTNKDQKFICLERALDTTKKYNLKHYLGDLVDVF